MSSRLAAAILTAGLSACSRDSAPAPTAAAAEHSAIATAPAPAPADTEQRRPEQPAHDAPAGSEPQVDLRAGIHQLEENRYEVAVEAVRAALKAPAAVAGSARTVPAIEDGTNIGFRVYSVRKDTVLARLGVRNGDTIRRANGDQLSSPEELLDLAAKLGDADEIRLDMVRGGDELTIVYDLVP